MRSIVNLSVALLPGMDLLGSDRATTVRIEMEFQNGFGLLAP
jgi:hypothetical protein